LSERKPPKVIFEYSKTADFKHYYVSGARGGPTPHDFRIDFYFETPRRYEKQVAGQPIPIPKELTVDRKEQVGIILSFNAAEQLHHWLGKLLAELKKRKKKKAEEVTEYTV